MSRFPEGFSLFRGLVVGILGALLWVGASVVQGVLKGLGGEGIGFVGLLLVVGYVIMFAGPAWYWIGRPAYVWWGNR